MNLQNTQRKQQPQKVGETNVTNREVENRENKTIITTTVDQELGAEEAVNYYNQQAEQILSQAKTVNAYEEQIQEVLGSEDGTPQLILHTLVEDQPQLDRDALDSDLANSMHSGHINQFMQLQNMKSQKDQILDQLPAAIDELEELHKAAQHHAGKQEGLTVETPIKDLRSEVEELTGETTVFVGEDGDDQ